MQAGANCITLDFRPPCPHISFNPDAKPTTTIDLPMKDFVTANSELTSSAAQLVVIRLQSRKRTAQSQAENKEAEELAPHSMYLIPPNAQTNTLDQRAQAPHWNRKNRSNTIAGTPRNTTETGNAGIEKAIKKAQHKFQAEEKERNEICMRIAKAVNVAMAAEILGKIEEYQVEYIINAIANCCKLPREELESQSKNTKTNPTL